MVNHSFLLTCAGILAGAIASISGFGIGSILTPLLATWIGIKLAVAVVSIPHFIGTALRFVVIREHVDRRRFVDLWRSQRGRWPRGRATSYLDAQRDPWLRPGSPSGVRRIYGNYRACRPHAFRQTDGVVSPAHCQECSADWSATKAESAPRPYLGFNLRRDAFVATATAIALLVDLFRMPVYAVLQFHQIVSQWQMATVAAIGVVVGTVSGKWMLQPHSGEYISAYRLWHHSGLGLWMLVHPTA